MGGDIRPRRARSTLFSRSGHPLFAIHPSWFAFAHFLGFIFPSHFSANWSLLACPMCGNRKKRERKGKGSRIVAERVEIFFQPPRSPPSLYPPFDIPCPTATGAARQAGCSPYASSAQSITNAPSLLFSSLFPSSSCFSPSTRTTPHQTLTAQNEFLLAFAPSLPNFGSPAAAHDATRRCNGE